MSRQRIMGDVRAAAARLKESLRQRGVEINNPDYEENFEELIRRLRGEQVAGAAPGRPAPTDPFGDSLRGLKDGLESPEAIFFIRTILGFLFVLSSVEDVPMVGNLLSVGLDLVTAAGKALMKIVVKAVPVLIGLIPLPYTSLIGLVFVAMIGMFVWPLLAAISFSRQDFTGAVDSMVRAIPPPLGEIIAETFLTANTTAGRVLPSMGKFVGELVGNIDAILGVFKSVDAEVSRRIKTGLEMVQTSFPKALPVTLSPASSAPPPAVVPPPPPATPETRGGRKPLSTKPHKGRKWTRAERLLYERFSGAGLR